MAFTALSASDVDAKSPVADSLMDLIRTNFDHLKSAISDGASAVQTLDGSSMRLRASGTALTVDEDASIGGDLTVTGTIITGDFFRSSDLMEDWILGGF